MLTQMKRLYADHRERGLGPTDAAVEAGYKPKHAKQRGYKLDRDPDVKRYRAKLNDPATPDAPTEPEPPAIPTSASDTDAARIVLRAQLSSRDERLAQNAAKIILDAEHKAKAPAGGKKAQKGEAAKAAGAGRFGAAQPPGLKAVN